MNHSKNPHYDVKIFVTFAVKNRKWKCKHGSK